MFEVYSVYNLVPCVGLKFPIRVSNFAASIFENVCKELCRAAVLDMDLCNFVLLLEVFDVVGWSDAEGRGGYGT